MRETLKGDPRRRKEPVKDPKEESARKTKDRKDESNEGDHDGQNERETHKGQSERQLPTESGTKPWRRTKEKENQKASLIRRKKGRVNERKTLDT